MIPKSLFMGLVADGARLAITTGTDGSREAMTTGAPRDGLVTLRRGTEALRSDADAILARINWLIASTEMHAERTPPLAWDASQFDPILDPGAGGTATLVATPARRTGATAPERFDIRFDVLQTDYRRGAIVETLVGRRRMLHTVETDDAGGIREIDHHAPNAMPYEIHRLIAGAGATGHAYRFGRKHGDAELRRAQDEDDARHAKLMEGLRALRFGGRSRGA